MKTDVVVQFKIKVIRDSVTRPANTTAYGGGDAISDATSDAHFTFSEIVKQPAYSCTIDNAKIFSSANVATLPDAELWLFHTDIAVTADNAAFAPSDAELLTLIGVIDFPVASWKVANAGVGAAGSAMCEVRDIGLSFRKGGVNDPDAPHIFGQLVARNAYVPVASEIFTVDIAVFQD